mgnify:CR=1 FL=1
MARSEIRSLEPDCLSILLALPWTGTGRRVGELEGTLIFVIANNLEIDVPAFVKAVRQKHNFLINGGYGKIKGMTFRLSNMGNETPKSMKELLAALDDVLPEFV